MTDGCHTLLSDPNFRSEPKRFGAETATDVRLLLLEVSWTRQVTRAAINRESECQLALSMDGKKEEGNGLFDETKKNDPRYVHTIWKIVVLLITTESIRVSSSSLRSNTSFSTVIIA